MTMKKNTVPTRSVRMSRLLGSVSFAVLVSSSPVLAQAVNVTVDIAQVAPASAFTAANVTGYETVANSTQDSRAAVSATIAGGVLDSNIAGSGSSAVGIEDNALTATASGNVFSLDADQLGSSGDGTAGTLATLSGQFADGTVSTSITNSSLTIDGTGDATSTSLAASGNTISATTTVNNATSVFSDDISADLAGDLAQANAGFITSSITLTGGDLTAQQLLSVAGGGSVVASTQAIEDAGLASTATATGSGISVSLGDLDATSSALSVDGNDLRTTLTGNRGSTGTDLTVDTEFDNTAAVLSQQQVGDGSNDVGLVSTADGSALAVGLDNATGSSLTVSSNTIGARANGNVAALSGAGAGSSVADGTFLRVDANSILANPTGGQINNNLESIVTFDNGLASSTPPGFGFVAGSQQAVASTNSGNGIIEASSDGNSLTVTAADSGAAGGALTGSTISVADNTAFALASANTGGTAIELDATSITATAGLASDQSLTNTGVNAFLGDGVDAFALSATAEGDVTSSSILVDGNLSVAEASGNTGQTLLSADADTALLSNNSRDRGNGRVNPESFTSATADFGVLANQRIGGSEIGSTAVSTLGVTIGEAADTPDDAGAIDGSTLSLSSNVQQATSSGNSLTNGIDLDANVIGAVDASDPSVFTDNSSVVSSLTSLQAIDSGTAAASTTTLSLSQVDFATADTTAINASSLTVDANENRSSATANRVTNALDVAADTAIIGADTLGGSASVNTNPNSNTEASGTSGLTNVQQNTGGIVAASTTTNAGIGAGGANATVASLAGSSASISDNITTASGASNIGASSITLNAGTETTSNAALTNLQDSTADVEVESTFKAIPGDGGIRTQGAVSDSTLGVDNNVSVASGMGNQTTNTVSVTATTIDRADSTATGDNDLFFTAAGVADVDADFAALNVQDQTGNISSAGELGATISLGATGGATEDAKLINSSATLNGNAAQSDAMSNLATNDIALTGTAAITETTTGLASLQTSGATGSAIIVDSASTATIGFDQQPGNGGVTNSTVSIDNNQSFDTATANRATNTVSLAGNAISGEAADLTVVGLTLLPLEGAQVLADNTLSSDQTSNAGVASVAEFLGAMSTGGRPVTDSSLSISDNFARSFGMGNDAANALSLLADTSVAGASALAGTQVQIGSVSAATAVTARLRPSGNTGSVADSSLATDGNVGFARAMGNNQSNTLSIAATEIDGVSGAGDNASITALGDVVGTNRVLAGDNMLSAAQSLDDSVAGESVVTIEIDTSEAIADSNVSASQNIAQSNVTGNAGDNLLSLAADTDVTGVSTLASEQSGDSSSAVSSLAQLGFTIDVSSPGASFASNSALNVNGNLGFSSAFGNDVTNRLTARGTTVTGLEDALSTVGIAGDDDTGSGATVAIGTISGASDSLLGNFQTRTGGQSVTSSASLAADLLAETSRGTDSITGSSATLNGNTLDSTATSNRASNTLALNAATGLTAGGAIANQQNSDSAVTSDVALRGSFGSGDFENATGSSIAMRDNTGIARAAGNDATNVLNASAGTAINALFAGTGGATVGTGTPGALNATGTFASASNQVNSGAVVARASFGALGDPTQSDLSVRTAALNGTSVDMSGNRLVADAVSNRVVNSMTVSGRSPSTDVSTALTTRQVATGAVTSRVDTFRVASTNAALTSSAVGLNGNTFAASASGNSALSRLIRD